MTPTQPATEALQVKHAEKNAKSAIDIIGQIIHQRFGEEGTQALTQRKKEFQEEFDRYPSDETRLELIALWAKEGVQQDNWAALEKDELLEMACRLNLLRAFLGEANTLMERTVKNTAHKKAEKKKKAKSKMASQSKRTNRRNK